MDTSFDIDGGDGVGEEMIKYGKVVNELVNKYYGDKYELFDIEESDGYEVDEDTELLVGDWVENEFQMNLLRFLHPDRATFPKMEYDRLTMENEKLANLIYDTYGTFDWIKNAEKQLRKKEKEFSKENPNYIEWSQKNTQSQNFNIVEDDDHKQAKPNLRKYKISVRDKKDGKISKVKFGDLNKRISSKDEKKEPRHWSAKWWAKNNIGKTLTEIVDPKTIDVQYLVVKPNLNPKIWENDDKLKSQVRSMLLKNALEFIKFLEMKELPIVDIVFTGSLANYTWTEFSDLDVHIVVDFTKLNKDSEFMGEYFRTKKSEWETKVKPTIFGYDVECYIEDTNEDTNSTGVYTLIEDKWRIKPFKQMIGIDSSNIQLKAAAFMNAIDKLEEMPDDEKKYMVAEQIKTKLKKYRHGGLTKEGEFSTENLVFKILRNSGYLQKLTKIKKDALQKELTLENKTIK
ncbi:MAG: hypothetical protein HC836_35275 [Richelia sp. RM2_1_2]|nr:hypothetical protein [Richelia sp. RM2_1_2]